MGCWGPAGKGRTHGDAEAGGHSPAQKRALPGAVPPGEQDCSLRPASTPQHQSPYWTAAFIEALSLNASCLKRIEYLKVADAVAGGFLNTIFMSLYEEDTEWAKPGL